MVAEIIVNSTAKQLNKTFDYIIPKALEKTITIGSRVFVPFGRIKKQEGFVIDIKQDSNFANKEIIEVEDSILPQEKIELSKLMARKYFCNISDCVKLMLPPGNTTKNINNRIKEKTANYVYLNKTIEEIDFNISTGVIKSQKQIRSLEFLKENNGIYIVDLETITDTTRAITKTLEKNGYIKIVEQQIERNPFVNKNIPKDKPLQLTEEQNEAYEQINKSISEENFNEFLIYGVTGSRKNRSIFTINKKCIR